MSTPMLQGVAAIGPAVTALDAATESGSQPRQRRGRARVPARNRLIAALMPDQDPERCEVRLDLATDGTLEGVTVREMSSGRVLARLSVDQVRGFLGEESGGGLLIERRG